MRPGSSRQRSPLGPLQSNTMGPPPRAGAKAAEGGSGQAQPACSSGSGGSRIPAAPAAGEAGVQRPGETPASRIPRAPSPTASAGEQPLLAPAPPAAAFSSHTNPLAYDGDEAEAECAASPALSWRTSDASPARLGQDLTPGLLDQAIYTPATARSIQAWLRSNTPGGRRGGPAGAGAAGRPTPGAGPTPLLPTPDAWQILEQLQQPGSPAPESGGGAGMFGIVNAYLRTGAQMLSPEPGGQPAIPAPAFAAAVVNRPRAAAVPPAAAVLSPDDPGSVRSASVSSCNAAAASARWQQLQEQQAAGAETEAKQQSIMLAPAVHARDEVPSVGDGAAAGQRPGPPSPISFNLPADSSPEASPARETGEGRRGWLRGCSGCGARSA